LEKYLGMREEDLNKLIWRNSGAVGKRLKSTSGWYSTENGTSNAWYRLLGYFDDGV
jgi:hypothetical protein